MENKLEEPKEDEPIWIEEHLDPYGKLIKGYWIGKKKEKVTRQQKPVKELDVDDDKPVCIIEVNENIRRVRLGEPLTRPLSILRKNCDFVKKYIEMDKIFNPVDRSTGRPIGRPRLSPEERKRRKREYYLRYKNSPVYKKRMSEYYRSKIYKEKQREYYKKNHDRLIQRVKEYRKNHVDLIRKWSRDYYWRKKLKQEVQS